MAIFAPFSYLQQKVVAEAPTPSNPPYYANLVRWYDAEDAGTSPSSTWQDLSGNVDGTVNTNVTFTTSGGLSYYDFAGTTGTHPDNTITYGANPFTGTTSHTIIGWLQPRAVRDAVWQFTGNNATRAKIVYRFLPGNAMRMEFQGGGATLSGLTYATNTWAQYAYSWGGTTAADVICYINGTSSNISNTSTLNLASNILMSGDQLNNPNQCYLGYMGVFLAYDFAMSSSQIAEVFEFYRGRYGV